MENIVKFGIVVKEINSDQLQSGDIFTYRSANKPYMADSYADRKHPAYTRTGLLFASDKDAGSTKDLSQVFYSEKSIHGNTKGKKFRVHLLASNKGKLGKASDYPKSLQTFAATALTFLNKERKQATEFYAAQSQAK